MQFLAAARVSILVALVGCVEVTRDAYKSDVDRTLVAAPTPYRNVAMVGELSPHPWKLGQWATYRTSARAYETISVVAIDTCGTWISDDSKTYETRVRLLICMRTPGPDEAPHPIDLVERVVVSGNDGPGAVIDFHGRDRAADVLRSSDAFAQMIARLMPAAWQGDTSRRETIDGPAGHFEMTVRTADTLDSKPATRWAHPDVPFDGTVLLENTDLQRYVLLAYGDSGAPSLVPELAANASPGAVARKSWRPRYRDFVAGGATSSWFTGLAGEQATAADGMELQDGVAMTSGLDLVAGFALGKLAHYSPDPALHEQMMRGTVGFHWRPFASDARPAAVSLDNVYVLADLGYSRLDRGMGSNMDQVTSGFVAGVGVGWTWRMTRGLGLSAELSDHALFYENDDITAHNLAASLLVDLYPFR